MFDNSNKYVQLVGGFIAGVFGVLQGIDWLFDLSNCFETFKTWFIQTVPQI